MWKHYYLAEKHRDKMHNKHVVLILAKIEKN